MKELIEKVKRISSDGKYYNREYRVNAEGVTVEKVCYTCDVVQSMDNFGKGGGFRGVHNECNECILSAFIETSVITIRGAELFEKALKDDPTLRFTPKYDRSGRRWLYFYEKDEFKALALAKGWKAVRETYDINQFTYGLLRKELFTPDEIEFITAKTPVTKRKDMSYQSFEKFTLVITEQGYTVGENSVVWLQDPSDEALYMVRGSRLTTYDAGDLIRFVAKRKEWRRFDDKRYQFLWYVQNRSIDVFKPIEQIK